MEIPPGWAMPDEPRPEGIGADADASSLLPEATERAELGTGPRIVVVDADEASARYMSHVLRRMGGHRVTSFEDPATALRYLDVTGADLLLADLDLPGMSGLELVRRARMRLPALPAIVMAATPSVDAAVEAVRARVDDFLVKPIAPTELLDKCSDAIARAGSTTRERVLAVGAHPDDVEIGAGGTLLAHRVAGDTVTILTLSGGARGGDVTLRRSEAESAAAIIGARLMMEDLEDTRIRESDPTMSIIERVIGEVKPTIMYTHSVNDVHQDHRNTHSAAMVAARRVPYVLCFQSPSATIDFRPSRFVNIEAVMDGKLEAIAAFATQASTRDYLDEDLLRATARYWARFGGGSAVEPFEVVRDRRRPGPASMLAAPSVPMGRELRPALSG
jgi:two-component system response regulator HydG